MNRNLLAVHAGKNKLVDHIVRDTSTFSLIYNICEEFVEYGQLGR